MTLIAGIISRDRSKPPPLSACEAIRRSISRDPGDTPTITQDESSYFARVDIGRFSGRAQFTDAAKNVTFLAGELLIHNGPGRDAETIHHDLINGDHTVLRQADGVFSAVHYRAATGELFLMTDKLGIRPVYYFVSDDLVIFASALRILEAVAEIPKVMDVRAVTEMVGVGFTLADRTPYVDIKLLRPAEIIRISSTEVKGEEYWRWDKVKLAGLAEPDILEELYQRFSRAVARRNNGNTYAEAYLSGGLDSRCIVSALRGHEVAVRTFNFARPDTQDQIFGRDFAAAAGTEHFEVPKQPGDVVPDYSMLMARALRSNGEARKAVWSGEGGSVALGHVHITPQMVEWMRNGRIELVIDEYLRRESAEVSPRIFRNGFSGGVATMVKDAIRTEIERYGAHDAARNFYLFLLLNDQHRKLARHFENIDLHRMEFQLPFFDGSFIELIVASPIDSFLRHRLYTKWLDLFPKNVTSVPWQTYPEHTPCPIAPTTALGYQWSADYQKAEHGARRRRVMLQATEMLGGSQFPAKLLDKRTLRLASWAHATGLRDYGYLISPAHTFYEYSEKCGGRYQIA